MSTVPYYSKLEADVKTLEKIGEQLVTPNNRITNLESTQVTSFKTSLLKSDLPATGTANVGYVVFNDPTVANNGTYLWDGSAYVKKNEQIDRTFIATDPSTVTTPPAGQVIYGTYNFRLWQKDENGKIDWYKKLTDDLKSYYALNGTSYYIKVAHNAKFDNGSNSFSYGCWFDATKGTISGFMFGKKRSFSGYDGYGLLKATDGAVLAYLYGSATNKTISSSVLTDGQKYFIWVDVDRTTNIMSLFIDDMTTPVATIDISAIATADNTYPITAGTRGDLAGSWVQENFYKGYIFNTILSSADKDAVKDGTVLDRYIGADSKNKLTGADVNFDTNAVDRTAFDAAYNWKSIGVPTISVTTNVASIATTALNEGIKLISILTAGEKFGVRLNVGSIPTGTWQLATHDGTNYVTLDTIVLGNKYYQFDVPDNSDGTLYLISTTATSSITIDASTVANFITKLGVILLLDKLKGLKTWLDESGNDSHAQVTSAPVKALPYGTPQKQITDAFTTDISAVAKVITIPAGYYVDSITIEDLGTTAGLSAISATQETSGDVLITGKAVATGASKAFKTIADHTVYSVDKNLSFLATGNSALGTKISVTFKR
jgi:hypothetical protein